MFKFRRSALVASLVGGLAALGLAACGDGDGDSDPAVGSDKPPIVVALNALNLPTSDVLNTYGAGADAAAKQINDEGGIGGRKVVVERCNTGYSPATAVVCARKTLAKEPIASVGCEPVWGSSGLPLYAKAKIPSINCPNSKPDFEDPYSIGMSSGANGDFRAVARWLCTRKDVNRVAVFTQDVALYHEQTPPTMTPVLEGCGKSVSYTYYPLAGSDLTPHVNRAVRGKPDFVVTLGGGATAVNIFKAFSQAGISADRMIGSSNQADYEAVLKPAGELAEGAYVASQTRSWGDTADPGIAAYLKAMDGSTHDPRGANQLSGYMLVMTIYTAAKEIGADKLTPQTLIDYLNSANDVAVPGTRAIVNPGPKDAPQIKQPYTQIVQWKDGKLNVVEDGTEDGWVNGQ